MTVRHRLKTREPFFSDVADGRKTFEVRRYDRPFRVGDELELVNEADPGQVCVRRVVYLLRVDGQRMWLTEFEREWVPWTPWSSGAPTRIAFADCLVVMGLGPA